MSVMHGQQTLQWPAAVIGKPVYRLGLHCAARSEDHWIYLRRKLPINLHTWQVQYYVSQGTRKPHGVSPRHNLLYC